MSLFFFLVYALTAGPHASAADPAALAERKLSELKAMVHRSHTRPAPGQNGQKNAAGLTPDQEARLFGKADAPADPAKIDYSRAWPTYMSEAEHKKLQDELRDKKLRFELRRKLSAQPSGASSEEKEAAGLMTVLLNEAEKRPGDSDKEPASSLKPLSPEDAFGIDPDDK